MKRLVITFLSACFFFPALSSAQTVPVVTGPHTWSLSNGEELSCAPHHYMLVGQFNYGGFIMNNISYLSLNIFHANNSSSFFFVNGIVKANFVEADGRCLPVSVSASGGLIDPPGITVDGTILPSTHYQLNLQISGGATVDCRFDKKTLNGPCFAVGKEAQATFIPK